VRKVRTEIFSTFRDHCSVQRHVKIIARYAGLNVHRISVGSDLMLLM
jgi:hypothetical protein